MVMAGMIGNMVIAGIPEDKPEAAKVKTIFRSVLGILMKLGPVLQKIDFYSSESSMKTYDGESLMRKESVVTYKPPRPPAEQTADKIKGAQ